MAIHHQPAPAARGQRETKTVVRTERSVRTERPVVRTERPVVRTEHNERREIRNPREQVRYERPIVERHIYARPIVRPIVERSVYVAPTGYWEPTPTYTVAPQPIQLMAPTSLASDQLSIDTGSGLGASTALELDAAGGTTFVSQVVLVDAYGQSQAIPVNQMLSAQNPTVQLPLSNGASIVRVIIDGHSDWGGQLAMRAL